MKAWRYKGSDKADLNELYSSGEEAPATDNEPAKVPVLKAFKVDLVPGEVFQAPDDWIPSPPGHPLFEAVVARKVKTPPDPEVPVQE